MATEWSPAEDLRPGMQLGPKLKTARGEIYAFIVTFRSVDLEPDKPDVSCYTQMTVRDCSGEYITTEGRFYSPPVENEDGA